MTNVIERDIAVYDGQFISINDMINMVVDCTNTQEQDVLEWIEVHIDEFEQILPLIKIDNKRIKPYSLYRQAFFNYHDEVMQSPIRYLDRVISDGGIGLDCDDGEQLGFAKLQTFIVLEKLGVKIKQKYRKNLTAYIPPKSPIDKEYHDDYTAERLHYYHYVMAYFNNTKQNDIDEQEYTFKIQVLHKAFHYIKRLNHYSGEKGYTKKVELFLETMAEQDDRYKGLKGNKAFIESLVGFLNSEIRPKD